MWLEIENNTDRPLILLPTAIDPEYFAPLEVAFAYHKSFAADANAALDEHLLKLNFPIRSLIVPGSQASGYIFTNWSEQVKAIDVDLMGDNFSQNFTFFAPNPNSDQGQDIVDRLDTMFSAAELQNMESEADLRQALEQLPCCVSNDNGGPSRRTPQCRYYWRYRRLDHCFYTQGLPIPIAEPALCLRTQPGHFREEAEPRVHQSPGAYHPDLADTDTVPG